MSVYGEIDPMVELRTQFAFKSKREYISKVNIPTIAYPSEHIDIEIPHGSRGHVTVPDTRHFSHVNKSRIFKNFNLRKKDDRNLYLNPRS